MQGIDREVGAVHRQSEDWKRTEMLCIRLEPGRARGRSVERDARFDAYYPRTVELDRDLLCSVFCSHEELEGERGFSLDAVIDLAEDEIVLAATRRAEDKTRLRASAQKAREGRNVCASCFVRNELELQPRRTWIGSDDLLGHADIRLCLLDRTRHHRTRVASCLDDAVCSRGTLISV